MPAHVTAARNQEWIRVPRELLALLLAAVAMLAVAACGGSSDEVGGGGDATSAGDAAGPRTTLSLVAFAVPKVGFDRAIPAFQRTEAGQNVGFRQSYGPSGDQSRKVAAGLEADVVNFSVEPDVMRLVDAGLVDEDWNAGEHNGIAFGSVVTIVTREGNPRGIENWDDLLQPGLEIVTPNPFSSGSAKWNLLAPYAAKSDGGSNPEAGLAFLRKLVGEHVKVQPKSGREATETFLQGTGDVLLSYENEAIFIERNGEDVEHVTPPETFKIENPVAVTKKGEQRRQSKAFVDFLYTPEGQREWAKAGFRPVDARVAREFAKDFPEPAKLHAIADLGGWDRVDAELFDPDNGSVAKIYDDAMS